jgi:hypothetical protein
MALATSAFDTTAIGFGALSAVTTPGYNTAVGTNALQSDVTGSENTALGVTADVATSALSNTLTLGFGATATASNTAVLGNSSVTDIYFGAVSPHAYGHFKGESNVSFPADTSYTAGLLGCPTSSGKIGSCPQSLVLPVVGVLLPADVSNGNANFVTSGLATVTFFATTPVTYGDSICKDATNVGYVVDTGSVACTTKQIGFVITSAATNTTQTIFVELGPGI